MKLIEIQNKYFNHIYQYHRHEKGYRAKGTILQAVMIEKELLKKVKLKAVHNEISFSEVINDALKQYFQ